MGRLLFASKLLAASTAVNVAIYVVAGLAALVALFFMFLIITSMCERQRMTGDIEPAQEPYPYPPSPYWQETRRSALQSGLHFAGDFATRKDASVVKGLQAMFITEDRMVIVAVISGGFAGAKLKKTVLRSRLQDGRALESSDNPGLGDLSGVMERAVLLNAGVHELLLFHRHRIEASGSSAAPFNVNNVEGEFERLDLEKAERWVGAGLARWGDPGHTCVRLTLKGSLANIQQSLFGEGAKLNKQSHRINVPRAGS